MLRPEIILNVGDLINGSAEDCDQLTRESDQFDARIASVRAPVFYIGGNHDLTNPVMGHPWSTCDSTRSWTGPGMGH